MTLQYLPGHRIVGHQTLAVSTSAVSLTKAGTNVERAEIHVDDAAIRWRADGTAPTASVGHPQSIDELFALDTITDIDEFQAIRSGGSDSELNIIYFARNP